MIKYPLNVTIDSNIFDSNMYDFESGSNLQLLTNYVKKGKIKIYLSNIVINEISKHIKKHAYDVAATINKACKELRKEHSDCLLKSIGVERYLNKTNRNQLANKAQESLDDFLDTLNIKILNNNDSNIDIDRIFEDYFEYNPPFEHSEKKRKEFPDAFIAAQIRNQFGQNEQLAIISNDNGFKNACNSGRNYLLFNSLNEFYDRLNREEEDYDEAVSTINSINADILADIKEKLLSNDCVIVNGLSVDKDGIESGHDYDETYVEFASDISAIVRSIDDMDGNHISATLLCTANIHVDCYYEDYDNAVWDPEDKEYIFLETKQIHEIHKARFGVRIDYSISKKRYHLSNFNVYLGGDTRKHKYEINRKTEHEQYLEDLERESVGLSPLGKYSDLLEEHLSNSKMETDIITFFDNYNEIIQTFENISAECYEVIEQIRNSPEEARRILTIFLENVEDSEALQFYKEEFSIFTNDDIDIFCNWLEEYNNELEKYSEIHRLPDCIHFGDTIEFLDAEKNKYTLSIEDIDIMPCDGDTEHIDVSLTNNSTFETIKGCIQLSVGFITFDEDGGVADSLEDDISYFYDSVLNCLNGIIVNLQNLLEKHSKINNILLEIE